MSAIEILCYSDECLKLCWVFLAIALAVTLSLKEGVKTDVDSNLALFFGGTGIVLTVFQTFIAIWSVWADYSTPWAVILLPVCAIMLVWGMIWGNHPRWTCSFVGTIIAIVGPIVALFYSSWTLFGGAWHYWYQYLA